MDKPCKDHGQRGTKQGYGSASYKCRTVGAHVKALIRASGEEPNGRIAMHLCDNPRCIEPTHLRWGTQADNMADMIAKGRSRTPELPRVCGEAHGCAKLSESQVKDLRARHAAGASRRELKDIFNISKSQVQRILTGASW